MATLVARHADGVLSANAKDVEAARGFLHPAALDRLTLDRARLDDIATQITALTALQPFVSVESLNDADYRIFPKLGIAARGQIAQALTLPAQPPGGHAITR